MNLNNMNMLMFFDILPKISNNFKNKKKRNYQRTFGINSSRITIDFLRTSSNRISSQ